MIKKVRPLTELELQQLRINQAGFEKELQEPFPFQTYLLIIFGVIVLILLLDSLIASILIGVIGIVMMSTIFNGRSKFKKEVQKKLKTIDNVLKIKEVEIIEYKCSRAIHFSLDEYFIENWFLLELDNKKILCLYTDYWTDVKSMPNTHFELYVDEEVQVVFMTKYNPLGTTFKPIHFSSEMYDVMAEVFSKYFKDEKIIDSSFKEILNEIERQLKS